MAKAGMPASLLAALETAKATLAEEEARHARQRRSYEPSIPLAKARVKVLELQCLISDGITEWMRTSPAIEAFRADLATVVREAEAAFVALEAVVVPMASPDLPLSEAYAFEQSRREKLKDLNDRRRVVGETLLAQYEHLAKRIQAFREREQLSGGFLHDPSGANGVGISAPIGLAIGMVRLGHGALERRYDIPRNARECREKLAAIAATRKAPPSRQDQNRADKLKEAQAELDAAQASWDQALEEMREMSVKR